MDFSLTYGESLNLSYALDDNIQRIIALEQDLRGVVPQLVSEIAGVLKQQWDIEAKNSLKRSDGYIQHTSIVPIDDLHINVENDHEAVWYIELGTAPFDMKRMLDSGAKVKISKDGKRYIRIPFNSTRDAFIKAGIAKEEIDAMKATRIITVNRPDEGRKRMFTAEKGDRLTDLGRTSSRSKVFPAHMTNEIFNKPTTKPLNKYTFIPTFREARPFEKISYTWKSSPYEGAIKVKDSQGKTMSMRTFRTISDNSDPNSWIHPGIQASHIAEKAFNTVKPVFDQEVAKIIKPIMDNFEQSLSQAGFKQ